MKPTNQQINAIRLALDLEAIAEREGVSFLEVLELAGPDPAQFVRDWIVKNYFDVIVGF